jgi:hypothetical protein
MIQQACQTDHPALRAWSELTEADFACVEIEVLKHRSESQVCRLIGLRPDGANVIAKRCPKPKALAEYRIYEELLRHLPLVSLRHYGLVHEKDTGFCWAFIEDAAGVPYSPDTPEHAMEATAWLAALHTSARGVAQDLALPDRGPLYYLHCLRCGRERIRQTLTGALLSEEDRTVLAALATQCDAVEAKWESLENLCSGAPQTFVHADLYAANIQVRPFPGGVRLVPFDWESAGWGVPAIDLALEGVDLDTYCAIAGRIWSGVDIRVARALSKAGRIFRLLELVACESSGLSSDWLWKPMKRMRYYRTEMSGAIDVL